jgi:hypothetical protein
MLNDSTNKIISIYFACVTSQDFVYHGVTYHPQRLRLSETLRRDFLCPTNCGGCCFKFSLDYIDPELKINEENINDTHNAIRRLVKFDGREVEIVSDLQRENKDHFCKFLQSDGRCEIHGIHPFSCDFELLRFRRAFDPSRFNSLGCFPYGRGWSFLRADKGRGAFCTMYPHQEGNRAIANNIRRLKRLEDWASYFGIRTKIPEIISWIKSKDKSVII